MTARKIAGGPLGPMVGTLPQDLVCQKDIPDTNKQSEPLLALNEGPLLGPDYGPLHGHTVEQPKEMQTPTQIT
jgi:hypothetical protein